MHADPACEHPRHALPATDDEWRRLGHCHACGRALLRLYLGSAKWVVRRVERVEFLDDRTVRRRVSVDYASPEGAVQLRRPSDDRVIRVVPLAVLRRKSLVNFDLRDEHGRPLPLMGLRETQALTLAVARSWAAIAIGDPARLPDSVERFVSHAIGGDQAEMDAAFRDLKQAENGPLATLKHDKPFRAVIDRLAQTFILYTHDDGAHEVRRIIKFAYDEPLTLRYRTSSYRGHGDPSAGGEVQAPTYGTGDRRMSRWERAPRRASLGLTPTRIRFPVPGAELAASFHFEIAAPPDVTIVEASLLAGLPNLYRGTSPHADTTAWAAAEEPTEGPSVHPARLRRRPSFDSVDGGDPTVNLHVADVPMGSLSRAQVSLHASTTGWLTTAVASTWLATATLLVGSFVHSPDGDLATTVLITFAAALVAVLARPDPHRMVTRLLSLLRWLTGASAALALAGAVAVAFGSDGWLLLWFSVLSAVPTFLVTRAWWLVRRRGTREIGPVPVPEWLPAPLKARLERRQAALRVRLSPWEQYHPDDTPEGDAQFHVELATELDGAPFPYDEAVRALRFDQPAIKVASSEGVRRDFLWDRTFHDDIAERLYGPGAVPAGR